MSCRDALRRDVLDAAGWGAAEVGFLAGDASLRRYFRLRAADGATAVLMDADPADGENVRPFVKIARHLTATGLSAPALLHCDEDRGFLLLEDLGDDLFASLLTTQPAREAELYAAATDALVTLQAAPPPEGLLPYDAERMTPLAGMAYSWYRAGTTGADDDAAQDFARLFKPMLAEATAGTPVIVLRDYHAQNLLWLPDRLGVARVGQLDFQDAMLGHPAYDLVSLLQDARREVAPETEEAMIARFVTATGADPETFRRAYDLLGIQRNLRILGVFARLCLAFGRPAYLGYLPRVWGLLLRGLARPGLEPLAARLVPDLPAPTPETLTLLEQRCATFPRP